MPKKAQGPDEDFVEWIMSFRDRPLDAVLAWYPWGEGQLKDSDGPDKWQMQVLARLQKRLAQNPHVIRIAVRSGHGIGKTSLMAWIIHWFASTRPNPQIVVTANTKTQLETKTWRELAKWKEHAINGDWFEWTATRYKLMGSDTWYASAIPWSKNNPQAFAGTHEKYVLLLFDEASAIDSAIWETAEGALTTTGTTWLAFGNPSSVTGRFAEIWGKFRHLWDRFQVDSRTAKMANQTLIKEWIETYGEDSDFVRVRVKGLPPAQGAKSLIGRADALAAAKREIRINDINPAAPLLMGVDIARDGNDDCVILLRKGPKLHDDIKVFKERDLMKTAGIVAMEINRRRPDVVFIDKVGMGAGVLDRLIQLGHDNVVGVGAGERADEPTVYFNRRIEMWHRMAVWIKDADIPYMDRLIDELTAPEFHYDSRELLRLETKDDMERRGIESPDCFVAGTLVSTPRGQVPIELLGEGDEVITPFGTTSVVKKWETETDELAVVSGGGITLAGKPKHGVFVWGQGWVDLGSLSNDNTMESDSLGNLIKWRFRRWWNTGGRSIGFSHAVGTTKAGTSLTRRDYCIAESGQTSTVRSRMAAAFTMLMEIGRITTWRIWNVCRSGSMRGSTCWSDSRMTITGKGTGPKLLRHRNPRSSGTPARRGESGTQSMEQGHGKEGSLKNLFAWSAGSAMRRISRIGRCIARSGARTGLVIAGIVTIVGGVLFAAVTFWRTSTAIRPVVRGRVRTGCGPVKTYNLTLLEDNAFYANGVLVKNCADALALTFAYKVPTKMSDESVETEPDVV